MAYSWREGGVKLSLKLVFTGQWEKTLWTVPFCEPIGKAGISFSRRDHCPWWECTAQLAAKDHTARKVIHQLTSPSNCSPDNCWLFSFTGRARTGQLTNVVFLDQQPETVLGHTAAKTRIPQRRQNVTTSTMSQVRVLQPRMQWPTILACYSSSSLWDISSFLSSYQKAAEKKFSKWTGPSGTGSSGMGPSVTLTLTLRWSQSPLNPIHLQNQCSNFAKWVLVDMKNLFSVSYMFKYI